MQVLPPGSTGGPSRLFILRPVATTLLMAAILLAGIIGYRFLPVAALPEVDDICLSPDIWPNWRSSGAVTEEVMT